MKQHRHLAGLAIGSVLPPLQHITPPVPAHSLPGWELEFLSDGRPYKCFVRALKQQAAEAEGRLELSYRFPEFDGVGARLVAVLQVAS